MSRVVEYELEFIVSFKSKDPIFKGDINTISFDDDLEAARKQIEIMKKDNYENLQLYKRVTTITTIDEEVIYNNV